MKLKKIISASIIIYFASFGCREKFNADIKSPPTGYLVVEGNINVGAGAVTSVTLSYSTPLDSTDFKPVRNGQIFIEDQSTNQYRVNETGDGYYRSDSLQLPIDRQYRLHIILPGGKEYYSTFTAAKISPPIDSLSWTAKDGGVEIQVTTHDDLAQSKYYQWSFIETWTYFSAYYAIVKFDGTNVVYRDQADGQIYDCWSSVSSSNITIASSVNLQQDIIFKKPVNFSSQTTTDKFSKRYSIIVYQQVLSAEAFEYLERMKKNSEQLGSIFDAQPSQLRGNITSRSDSSEIVVGFVGASTVTEKRIFITSDQLPPIRPVSFYLDCIRDTVANNADLIKEEYGDGTMLPFDYQYGPAGIVGIIGSTAFCVDCRLKGGTNIKPDFWP